MMMATTTTAPVAVAVVVAQQTKEEIARLFPAAVYGGRVARALDALAALEACVRADALRGPLSPETALLVRHHWRRMPLPLLVRHTWHKVWVARRNATEPDLGDG